MTHVTLYKDYELRGDNTSFSAACKNLKDVNFNDDASSCVVKDGYWMSYTDTNYQGHCAMLPPGVWGRLPKLNMGNDKMSSLRPLPKTGLALFKDTGWRGEMVHIDTSISNLKDIGFNDAMSSLVILSGSWRFFQDTGFGGMYWTMQPGTFPAIFYNAGAAGMKNDSVSSIQKLSD